MANKVRNREWVKTAAIVLLSALLVLTFFSNTIRNRHLPEVSTAEVTEGQITAKVRGKGNVTAIGNTEIKSNATTTIASVKVKEGQTVNEGDVLFIMGEQSEELEAAQSELDSLQFELQRINASYPSSASSNLAMQRAEQNFQDAQAEYDSAVERYYEVEGRGELKVASEQVRVAQDNLNNVVTSLNAVREASRITYESEKSAYETDEKAYKDAKLAYEQASEEEKEQKYQEMLEAQNKMEGQFVVMQKALAEYNALLETQPEEKQALTDLTKAQDYYDTVLLTTNLGILSVELEAAETKLEAAKNALNSAYDSAAVSQDTNNKAAASNYISALETQNKITKLEEKIKNLQGGEDSEGVKAPVGGIIASVEKTAGSSVAKGDVLCTIEVPDQGYQVSFSITNDQAKRIKVGDTGTISNYYYGQDITATVTSIKTDKESPQNKKLVTCDLEGDVDSGAELTVSIGSKSATYDTIVPKSAVRTDSNGTYVLAIESKNSSLGNRYFAKRVEVEELAADDLNIAVSGDLGYGDFVITTSSEKISNKDQVRMADAS